MGYSTEFNGRLKLDRKMEDHHAEYLRLFSRTRRIQRDECLTYDRPDPVREAVGLPVGIDGGYFVGAGGYAGQERGAEAPDIINYNDPPAFQPGLWCQWTLSEDATAIEWDGGEKFYCYVDWINYIIEHFIIPWGYTLNGEIHWQGEGREDAGTILCVQNAVRVYDKEDYSQSALEALALSTVTDWEYYDRPEPY